MEAAAEARLAASGKASGCSSVIEATEGSGMGAGESVLGTRESSCRCAAMKSAAAVKVTFRNIEMVAIDEDSAVGLVGVVVETNIVVMPVVSPVVPAPAKPAKKADSEAETKRNSWNPKVKPWIRIPARPDPDRISIDEPRVVLGNVNNLRIGWFDHNGLPLVGHLF